MTTPVKAIVLGAGVGSRLEPLTSFLPKPLVPVVNRPIMEHILALLKHHGITEVASNAHYLGDKLIEHFANTNPNGMKLNFVKETELSGDAGGVRSCKKYLMDSTFVVLMGDLLTAADLTELIRAHKANHALATIAVKKVDDVSRFGVIVADSNGFITDFQEKPSAEEARSNLVSTGIYVLEPAIFNYIPEQGTVGFGKQLFPELVQTGKPILSVETHTYWSDIGTIASYWQTNLDALSGKLGLELPGQKTDFGRLGSNSTVSDGATIEGVAMIGNNTVVDNNVRLSGHVVIGNNCRIGANARLENAIIWDNVTIGSSASLTDCVVGFNCLVKVKKP